MVDKIILFSLFLFQFCGFYPVSIRRLSDSNCDHGRVVEPTWNIIFTLWSLLHAIIIMILIVFMAVMHDEMLYSATPIGHINDILVYFSLLIAHLLIVIETFVKKNYFSIFWNSFKKINTSGRPRNQKWLRRTLKKIVWFIFFTISIEGLLITNITQDIQWTNFWYAEIFSLLLTRIRHLQEIFFVDVIFHSLMDMNSWLRKLILWTKTVGTDKETAREFLYKNVLEIREDFKNLMKMLICVNRIFCWSQVLNIGQHFVEVTSELYWIYAYTRGPLFLWRKIASFLFMEWSNRLLSATLIVFLPTVVVIVMLLNSTTRCIKEVQFSWICILIFSRNHKL